MVEAEELMESLQASPLNKGVTLSGGEPFCQAEELLPFARLVKAAGMSLWAYSGYTFEQLVSEDAPRGSRELMALCDVLVDGPYVEALSSYSAHWRGSTNQRLIDLPASLPAGRAVLWQAEDPLAAFTRPAAD